ncbi:MAG: hypothetical protein AB1726_17615 [Planctomycetota bacterium]
MSRPLLLFTIDVEEDMPGWRIEDSISVQNVAALPRMAELCRELGVRPTYLCTYPTVTAPSSAAILRGLAACGDCEIGSHMHPWNTPPFNGVPGRSTDERRTTYYQFELGPRLFAAKLARIHDAVSEVAMRPPVSYRAGRFGIDSTTLAVLIGHGYEVDSSITPLEEHLDDEGPDFRSAPQFPYRPSLDDVTHFGDMSVVEIPVSVALTRPVPDIVLQAYVYLPKATRMRGLLSRDYLRIIDFAWLYPARFDVDLMIRAATTLVNAGNPVLNVFLHSSELVAGASGRISTSAQVEEVFARTRGLLCHCLEVFGAAPATMREAARELRPSLGL